MTYKTPLPGVTDCINYLTSNYNFSNLIDVGCGYAPYIELFNNTNYTGIDILENDGDNFINSEFNQYDFKGQKYECVFTAHCIEHQPNVEIFLRKIRSIIKDNGVLCILWPPPKDEVVGGHVNLFNPGIVLYNLTRIGIDCSKVKCIYSGYTYGVVGNVSLVDEVDLIYDKGDIELLAHLFPFDAKQNFHGVRDVSLINL